MEWKFFRFKLWMGYFDEGFIFLFFFNLIISFKFIYYVVFFFKNFFSFCINKSRFFIRSKRRIFISSVKVRRVNGVLYLFFL